MPRARTTCSRSSRAFDLHALIEDELLLALPLVPRHDDCPSRCRAPAPTPTRRAEERPQHPFAALAALRRKGQ